MKSFATSEDTLGSATPVSGGWGTMLADVGKEAVASGIEQTAGAATSALQYGADAAAPSLTGGYDLADSVRTLNEAVHGASKAVRGAESDYGAQQRDAAFVPGQGQPSVWNAPLYSFLMKTANMAPTVAAMAVFPEGAVAEAATGAGLQGSQFVDRVLSKSNDMSDGDLRRESPVYAHYRDVEGMDESEARSALTRAQIKLAPLAEQAIVGSLAMGGPARLLKGAASSSGILGRMASGATEAGLSMGAMSGAGAVGQQQAAIGAGTQSAINWHQVLGESLEGALQGSIYGGALGIRKSRNGKEPIEQVDEKGGDTAQQVALKDSLATTAEAKNAATAPGGADETDATAGAKPPPAPPAPGAPAVGVGAKVAAKVAAGRSAPSADPIADAVAAKAAATKSDEQLIQEELAKRGVKGVSDDVVGTSQAPKGPTTGVQGKPPDPRPKKGVAYPKEEVAAEPVVEGDPAVGSMQDKINSVLADIQSRKNELDAAESPSAVTPGVSDTASAEAPPAEAEAAPPTATVPPAPSGEARIGPEGRRVLDVGADPIAARQEAEEQARRTKEADELDAASQAKAKGKVYAPDDPYTPATRNAAVREAAEAVKDHEARNAHPIYQELNMASPRKRLPGRGWGAEKTAHVDKTRDLEAAGEQTTGSPTSMA